MSGLSVDDLRRECDRRCIPYGEADNASDLQDALAVRRRAVRSIVPREVLDSLDRLRRKDHQDTEIVMTYMEKVLFAVEKI